MIAVFIFLLTEKLRNFLGDSLEVSNLRLSSVLTSLPSVSVSVCVPVFESTFFLRCVSACGCICPCRFACLRRNRLSFASACLRAFVRMQWKQKGDNLVAINDEFVADAPMQEVVQKVIGPEGSEVTVWLEKAKYGGQSFGHHEKERADEIKGQLSNLKKLFRDGLLDSRAYNSGVEQCWKGCYSVTVRRGMTYKGELNVFEDRPSSWDAKKVHLSFYRPSVNAEFDVVLPRPMQEMQSESARGYIAASVATTLESKTTLKGSKTDITTMMDLLVVGRESGDITSRADGQEGSSLSSGKFPSGLISAVDFRQATKSSGRERSGSMDSASLEARSESTRRAGNPTVAGSHASGRAGGSASGDAGHVGVGGELTEHAKYVRVEQATSSSGEISSGNSSESYVSTPHSAKNAASRDKTLNGFSGYSSRSSSNSHVSAANSENAADVSSSSSSRGSSRSHASAASTLNASVGRENALKNSNDHTSRGFAGGYASAPHTGKTSVGRDKAPESVGGNASRSAGDRTDGPSTSKSSSSDMRSTSNAHLGHGIAPSSSGGYSQVPDSSESHINAPNTPCSNPSGGREMVVHGERIAGQQVSSSASSHSNGQSAVDSCSAGIYGLASSSPLDSLRKGRRRGSMDTRCVLGGGLFSDVSITAPQNMCTPSDRL